MPDGIILKIEGAEQVNRGLQKIKTKVAKKVVTGALSRGARFIAAGARQGAPKRTGRLRGAIQVKKSKLNTKPQFGYYGYYIRINPGRKRDDPKGAYYGNIVDGGWNTHGRSISSGERARLRQTWKFGRRTGRKTAPGRTDVPGQKFMIRAFRNRARRATQLTIRLMEAGVKTARRQAGFR